MGFGKSILGGAILVFSSVVANAGGDFGFKCTEFDFRSRTWGQEELQVNLQGGPRGTDLTVWKTAEKVQTFDAIYQVQKSPHYRWGYEGQYSMTSPSSRGGDAKTEVNLSVRWFGPSLQEDGSYGYRFDGATANLTQESNAEGIAKQVSFSCDLIQ